MQQKTRNKKQKRNGAMNALHGWHKGRIWPLERGGGTACLTCTHRHREMNERRRARVLAETMRAAAWGADAEHTHTHTEGGGTQGANGKEEEEEEETTWRGDGGAKECSWCACVRWHVMACAASLLRGGRKSKGGGMSGVVWERGEVICCGQGKEQDGGGRGR